MHVKVLGSAAGGGFPQWNCACPNCRRLRSGRFSGRTRSQTQLAISHDGRFWFLLGASPDLRSQIESAGELQPKDGNRSSPLSGVILLGAELDQVLGLLLLREFQPLAVHATESVIRILRERNSMFAMLNRMPGQTLWRPLRPGESFCLSTSDGRESGIRCTPVSLSARYPAYVTDTGELSPSEASLGLFLTSATGARVAYLPSVERITPELEGWLERSQLVLFDGTFYSEDELRQLLGFGPLASEMGHIPVGGENGSLRRLARLRADRKLYIHINNTNPMLDESGPQYRELRDRGWELAEDGWQTIV